MKPGLFAFWGLILLVLGGLYGWRVYGRHDQVIPAPATEVRAKSPAFTPRPIADFVLTERSGEPFNTQSLKGQVWVVNFFFANCEGVCLKLSNSVSQLAEELDDPDLKFVSITVDPEHDTPASLCDYARRFKATDRWLFLTGEMEAIKQVGIVNFQVSAGPGVHSDRLFVIDRDGTIQGSYNGSDPTQMTQLKRKVRDLLGEKS